MKNQLIKYLVPGLLLAGHILPLQAQTALPYVFASAGGSATVAGGNVIDFTIGESFIATVGSNPRFTQGFQQPSTSGTPLGVQLLDFSGQNKKAYNFLIWHTAQEKNNDYFMLERSADGNTFDAIATVQTKAPNGYSAAELAYVYTDRTMVSAVNYYRLKQVDRDGRYSYSTVVRLERNATAGSVLVAPNPAREQVGLYVEGIVGKADVHLTDITGRILQSLTVSQRETTIDMSTCAAGIYIIRYEDAQRTESVKVVKQ